MINKKFFLLHLAIMLFGLAGVIGKSVTIPAILVTLGRVFFSSLFLLILLLIKKEKILLNKRRDYWLIGVAGIVMAIHWFTFLQAIQISTVAVGTITFATFPLFITFLEPLIYHEKLKKENIIMAFIMFVGVLITIPEFSLENKMTIGIVIGMLGSLSYAVLCLINRYFTNHYSGTTICFYEQGVATLLLFPALFVVKTEFTTSNFMAMIFLGIVCTAIAHSIYVSCLKQVGVQTAGIISGMETVYSIVFAFMLLHEIPSIKELFGGLIILGVALYSSMDKKEF